MNVCTTAFPIFRRSVVFGEGAMPVTIVAAGPFAFAGGGVGIGAAVDVAVDVDDSLNGVSVAVAAETTERTSDFGLVLHPFGLPSRPRNTIGFQNL